jgi:hypothetical protein
MNVFQSIIGLAALLLSPPAALYAAEDKSSRPNILSPFADDHRADTTSAPGSPIIRRPTAPTRARADVKSDFVNPPLKFRARPLWFWNNTNVTAAEV